MTSVMSTSYQARFWSFGICALVIVLDHITKNIATALLEMYKPVAIFPWFDMLLVHNKGAAFSFLADEAGWQRWFLLGVSLLVSLVLLVWMWRLGNSNHLLLCALTCIAGGAIGNAIDRAMLGYVVDFIAMHYKQHYFPAFNIADSAISIGATLLLLDAFRQHQQQKRTQDKRKQT